VGQRAADVGVEQLDDDWLDAGPPPGRHADGTSPRFTDANVGNYSLASGSPSSTSAIQPRQAPRPSVSETA
jgi:hypothetical protein